MGEMTHAEKERLAAGLSRTMLDALLTAASLTGGYGRNTVLATPRTVRALVDRALIRGIGPTGAAHYLTPLGREVLRLRAGSDVVKTIDELQAEALTEDTARFPYSGNERDLTVEQAEKAARKVPAFGGGLDEWARRRQLAGRVPPVGTELLTLADLAARVRAERPATVDDRVRCRCPRGRCDHVAPTATPADDLRDEIDQSIDRLIRAAQFRALSEVIKHLDGTLEVTVENHHALEHRSENVGEECWTRFHPDDFRDIVNAAAYALGIGKP